MWVGAARVVFERWYLVFQEDGCMSALGVYTAKGRFHSGLDKWGGAGWTHMVLLSRHTEGW